MFSFQPQKKKPTTAPVNRLQQLRDLVDKKPAGPAGVSASSPQQPHVPIAPYSGGQGPSQQGGQGGQGGPPPGAHAFGGGQGGPFNGGLGGSQSSTYSLTMPGTRTKTSPNLTVGGGSAGVPNHAGVAIEHGGGYSLDPSIIGSISGGIPGNAADVDLIGDRGEANLGDNATGTETVLGPPDPGDDSNKSEEQKRADIEAFIRWALSNATDVDTAEEEALIRELQGAATGRHLMDSAASAGAAGFAQSGAQLALEGGIRQDGAQRTQQAILDLRDREQQQAIDNALSAIGADADLRAADFDEAWQAAMMDMINEDNGDGIPDVTDDEDRKDYTEGRESWDYSVFDKDAEAGSQQEPYLSSTAEKDDLEEAGYQFTTVDGAGPWGQTLYIDQDGRYWYFDDDPGRG